MTATDPYAGYDDFGGEMDAGRYDGDDCGHYGDSRHACQSCGGWARGRHAGDTAGLCRYCCPARVAAFAAELAAEAAAHA